ncbi:MAG TPA: carboxylating nicotinate-nucleotide diphosphorylase [Thermoanaerobaculia bacterium]|nr:carboxylating nicotinate-nucleotide diphosphorylase [Thermoanaerobaculia bacterium]
MRGGPSRPSPLPPLLYEGLLRAALAEDLGRAGDLTTDAVAAPGAVAAGELVARQEGCVAGLGVALAAFRLLDPELREEWRAGDGDWVPAGTALARIEGSARALLAAERVALNVLGRLCGIATATRRLVDAVAGSDARIVCTRKTTPGLRALEKYAVRAGGGVNHRFGLDDAVLVKDNHLALAGGVREAVARVRRRVGHLVKIEVEVDTLEQLDEALACPIDAVLLDNMSLDALGEAVRRAGGRVVTEASGGITLQSAPAIAATGVDLLSVGWLTHSAPALDVAFDLDAPVAGA